MKKLFLIFMFLFASALIVNGQTSLLGEQPKVVKAVAPKYPLTAVAVRAESKVAIEVKINREGEVTSANVKSGHKLLQKISENAAKKWQFDSTTSSESTRKVTLVFSFRFSKDKKDEAGTIFKHPLEVEVVSDWYVYNQIAAK